MLSTASSDHNSNAGDAEEQVSLVNPALQQRDLTRARAGFADISQSLFLAMEMDEEILNERHVYLILNHPKRKNKKRADLEAALDYLDDASRSSSELEFSSQNLHEQLTLQLNTAPERDFPLLAEAAFRAGLMFKKPQHEGNKTRALEIVSEMGRQQKYKGCAFFAALVVTIGVGILVGAFTASGWGVLAAIGTALLLNWFLKSKCNSNATSYKEATTAAQTFFKHFSPLPNGIPHAPSVPSRAPVFGNSNSGDGI